MKIWIYLALSMTLAGCSSKYRIFHDSPHSLLKLNEGYFSFVIDTLDALRTIEILNVETDTSFYVGNAAKGYTQITLKVPEGEYCFIGFDVYNLRVDYKDKGFCTYVEAGELNYFTQFTVRNPVTTARPNFSNFVKLLKSERPDICKEFINKDCSA